MRASRWGLAICSIAMIAAAFPSPAVAACTVTTQAVNFGSYEPLANVPLDGVGNVRVRCDLLNIFVTVSLSPGAGTYSERRMTAGPAHLKYNLYRDSSRLFVWGEGPDSRSSAIVLNLDLPVYGRIPASQNVPVNLYADAIVVTVAY